MMRYVSLHHHSTFSYGDGFAKPEAHVKRAEELGMSALALTEHGNTSSHVQLEKAAKGTSVKPIFGVEAYTAPQEMREQPVIDEETGEPKVGKDGKPRIGNQRKWHQTILAMDTEGYQNLNQLVTKSWAEGFYRWPTMHWDMYDEHHRGLVMTSGCADSLLACTLLGGKNLPRQTKPNIPGAMRVIEAYKELLGDRYYLEVQQFPELERARTLNPIYAELSRATGVPLVATSDCHYPYPDDNEMQKILHSASRNTGTVAAAEAEWEYDVRLTFPLSDKMIQERLMATGLSKMEALRAIHNTEEIASRCNVTLPRSEVIRFPCERYGFSSVKELLWEWLRQGWRYRWQRNAHMRKHKQAYWDKIVYEMSIIEPKDYMDYFAMLSDCVRWAKDNGIPVGPARGSAAASLVCYILRITEVDPMLFPTMMFERFIDLKREDLPDVDLDFADDRRDEVRLHLVELYGADHVGNIGNFGRYRGKNALDAVGRVHQVPKWEVKTVKDLVIERSGGDSRFDASLEDTFEMFPKAAEVLERWPILAQAIRLEGNYERMGVHAAGLVVSNMPITDTCAMYHKENVGKDKKTVQVIAYDKKDAEYLGMLKADFLGLKTMGMIMRALNTIGMSLDALYQVPLDDPETIEAFRTGDVQGIFQFEGRATRLMTMDVMPDNFMEIADINALSRPGPLFSGASATYVEIKHGEKQPEHLHPIVDKYTKSSQYQIIYQEQVLGIIREMGGFPVAKVADIRKIISQKLGEASFNAMREEFVKGAKEHHGVEEELADRIWKLMVTSATYSFNIAHCISYGMLAFWSMWLKVHHPVAFYAAQLSKVDDDKWPALIRDASDNAWKFGREPIAILPPDIKLSGATWEPHPTERAVLAGFTQVPGIADSRYQDIKTWLDSTEIPRDEMEWRNLRSVKGIGPKTIEKIEKWVASDDPFELYYAMRVLGELREYMSKRPYDFPFKPTVTSDEVPREADWFKMRWVGIPKLREYKDYIEDQRARSGETVEEIMAAMDRPDLVKGCVLKCYDDGDEEVYLRFNRFRFPMFKDMLEEIKLDGSQVVLIEGVKRKGFGINVQVKRMYVLNVSEEEDELEDAS
jgi:DNA polymerase-3 subunit alpha